LVGSTRRPDIASHRPPPEFYEVKPFTPAGVRDGLAKLTLFSVSYPVFGFPYVAGVTYNPTREMPLGIVIGDAGENMEVFLEVHRPIPGLIVYRICLRGDYVRYFNRVRVIAGALAILIALAPALLPATEATAVVAAIQELATAFSVALPLVTAW
jgi:hypothetical protein